MTEGAGIDAEYLLQSKEVRAARTGEAYLSVELADKTGTISGVHFRPSTIATDTPVGSVVAVRGVVTSYRGIRRVSVEKMRPASRWNPDDLIASSPRSEEEMRSEFTALVRSVANVRLRAFLRKLFGDKPFFARFSACPGAPAFHHAYLKGLIEHTIAVAELCSHMAAVYPGVDRDLLVTAALVHDIGRVDELRWDTAIGHTDDGRLLGDLVLGLRRVNAAADSVGLPADLRRRLEHALLAREGERGSGPASQPATIEAVLLHHADHLDSAATSFAQAAGGALAAQESWTDSENPFGRRLYVAQLGGNSPGPERPGAASDIVMSA